MTGLTLIRHGLTDWNLEGRFQGQADQPLNDAGRRQAEALAASLKGRRFDAIVSSDLTRAVETAEQVSGQLGLALRLDPRLREINQGEWEGLLGSDIRERYADMWAAQRHNLVSGRAPGGESVAEVSRRVSQAADDIARCWPNGNVLVVSHGLALATLIVRARALPLEEVFALIPAHVEPIDIAWPPA